MAIVGGERDLHVNAGSTVTIQCVISQSIEQPAFVFWHHDERLVMSPVGGRHQTSTERTAADTTVSTLIIRRVDKGDSGNYTCRPSNLPAASVLLHVLNGEGRGEGEREGEEENLHMPVASVLLHVLNGEQRGEEGEGEERGQLNKQTITILNIIVRAIVELLQYNY